MEKRIRRCYGTCRQKSSNRHIVMYVYTLSLHVKYTNTCNLIMEIFLKMEEERHGDKTKAFACIMFTTENSAPGNPAKTAYLCNYIKKIYAKDKCPSVCKRKLLGTMERLVNWNESLNYYSKIFLNYTFVFAIVTFYYFDLAKDLLLTYTYYHFSGNVLVKTDPNVRFESVGGIQFDYLMPYSVLIIVIS